MYIKFNRRAHVACGGSRTFVLLNFKFQNPPTQHFPTTRDNLHAVLEAMSNIYCIYIYILAVSKKKNKLCVSEIKQFSLFLLLSSVEAQKKNTHTENYETTTECCVRLRGISFISSVFWEASHHRIVCVGH